MPKSEATYSPEAINSVSFLLINRLIGALLDHGIFTRPQIIDLYRSTVEFVEEQQANGQHHPAGTLALLRALQPDATTP